MIFEYNAIQTKQSHTYPLSHNNRQKELLLKASYLSISHSDITYPQIMKMII